MSVKLEGKLQKWTNYLDRWQDRHFLLDNGFLSYYKPDEENCRGSMNIFLADVQENEKKGRVELTLNEAVWYLRAKDTTEIQSWLDAFQACKEQSHVSILSPRAASMLLETRAMVKEMQKELRQQDEKINTIKTTLPNFSVTDTAKVLERNQKEIRVVPRIQSQQQDLSTATPNVVVKVSPSRFVIRHIVLGLFCIIISNWAANILAKDLGEWALWIFIPVINFIVCTLLLRFFGWKYPSFN